VKLVTFVLNGRERVGSLHGEQAIDLREARILQLSSQGLPLEEARSRAHVDLPDSMLSLIEGGEEALAVARAGHQFAVKHMNSSGISHSLSSVKLKAPLPRPPAILNMGNAYRPFPIKGFTIKPVTGVIGPEEPIVIPKEVSEFGAVFECEIGVVIGKRGRRIPNDDTAYDYVYGYTIYNDVTDYGRQMREVFDMKIFDTFCPMGPCLVTKDEIHDPYNLTKRAWVNGQLATERPTREMLHKIPEFISVASQTLTVLPGTVIGTGAANAGRLKPGDVLGLEITGIGKMRNPVIAEQ